MTESQQELLDAIDKLATWQTRVGHGCKLFFLDGYDEASSRADMGVLLQEAERIGTRIIVTSRSKRPSSLLERFRSIDLSSMSRRDATAVLAEFGIAGSEAQAVVRSVTCVVDCAEGSPAVIRHDGCAWA